MNAAYYVFLCITLSCLYSTKCIGIRGVLRILKRGLRARSTQNNFFAPHRETASHPSLIGPTLILHLCTTRDRTREFSENINITRGKLLFLALSRGGGCKKKQLFREDMRPCSLPFSCYCTLNTLKETIFVGGPNY